MAVKKRDIKKNNNHEKVHVSKRVVTDNGEYTQKRSMEKKEKDIVRKFHNIQKNYAKLIDEVSKELDLVKGWISSKAMTRGNDIKSKLKGRLSRD